MCCAQGTFTERVRCTDRADGTQMLECASGRVRRQADVGGLKQGDYEYTR
jgi:hypothetical protein